MRGGVALLAGILIGGIVERHLALVGVRISLGALTAIDLALVLAGVYRWRRASHVPRPAPSTASVTVLAPIALLVATVELAHVAGTAAVRPMLEWDSWAIWDPRRTS